MAAAATPAMAISLISFFIVVCDAWAESQGRSPPTTRQKVSPGPQNAAPGSDKMCYLPGITRFGTGAGGPGSEAQDERASPAKATTTAIIFAIFILELCVFQVSKTGPNNSTQYYRNLKVYFVGSTYDGNEAGAAAPEPQHEEATSAPTAAATIAITFSTFIISLVQVLCISGACAPMSRAYPAPIPRQA